MVYVIVFIKINKKHYFWRNLNRFTEKATSPEELNFIPQWIRISWSSMDKNKMQDKQAPLPPQLCTPSALKLLLTFVASP